MGCIDGGFNEKLVCPHGAIGRESPVHQVTAWRTSHSRSNHHNHGDTRVACTCLFCLGLKVMGDRLCMRLGERMHKLKTITEKTESRICYPVSPLHNNECNPISLAKVSIHLMYTASTVGNHAVRSMVGCTFIRKILPKLSIDLLR